MEGRKQMSRLIAAIGFMGVASLISFIAGFAFCQWGHQERAKGNESFQAYKDDTQWN